MPDIKSVCNAEGEVDAETLFHCDMYQPLKSYIDFFQFLRRHVNSLKMPEK